jgi:hypothetical protein
MMTRLFKRTKKLTVDFCERCARVCDAASRQAELRERTLLRALQFGVRV